MIFTVLLALASLEALPARPDAARNAYRTCAMEHARSFHEGDLSGDPAEIVSYAAIYSCSRERFDFIQVTEAYLRARHADLGPGSLAKTTAIFVEGTDTEIEQEVAGLVGGASAPSGNE